MSKVNDKSYISALRAALKVTQAARWMGMLVYSVVVLVAAGYALGLLWGWLW